jgi:hypothetical protein
VSQASVTQDTIVVRSVPTERMSRCAYTARAPLAHEGETLSTAIRRTATWRHSNCRRIIRHVRGWPHLFVKANVTQPPRSLD